MESYSFKEFFTALGSWKNSMIKHMGFTNPGRFVLKKLMLEEVQKQVEFLFLLYYNTNRRTESAPHL